MSSSFPPQRDSTNSTNADAVATVGEEEQQAKSTVRLPGTDNLTSYADKRVLVWLRDNRKLFGVLRSYDQFGNLWLTDTVERFYHHLEYAERKHGNYLVRGENVVLLGDFEPDSFQASQRRMAKFRRPLEYVLPLVQEHTEHVSQQRRTLGANGEFAEHDLY